MLCPIKNTVFFILALCICDLTFAQSSEIEIFGILIENKIHKHIPYATIILKDIDTNKTIGTTSDEKGEFNLRTHSINFIIEISSMSFKTKTIRNFSIKNRQINLGFIELVTDSQDLDEVVVRAEVSKTTFELDKRIFNVGKDISNSGASALEALNSVPSVNVSIEGDISLRGNSSVEILINGKPSVLADDSSNALGTITADMIDNIEVITSPSAKYEASGTGGILNIILKKEEKKGWNGSISLNAGVPDNQSVGLSINRRTEKFNLFSQIGVGYRSLPMNSNTNTSNLETNETIVSKGIFYRNETFANITLGTDYHINDLNILTLSGNFAYELEDQPSEINFNSFDMNNKLISSWLRKETTEATNPKYQYELNYNKEFKNNKEHILLISALGSYFGKDLSSEFENTTTAGEPTNSKQRISTDYLQADYTFKLDYTKPITKTNTLEAGAQYVINDVANDYIVSELFDRDYIIDEELTNNFEYNQRVFGIYATSAYKTEKWGIKAGLRIENTDLNTLLTNTNEVNKRNFTNYFPSFHSSYKATEQVSFQAGYSRRIFRPRLRDLNPFFNIRNPYNIRVGNPDLKPEFSDSYEITTIFKIGKTELNSSIYLLFTSDVIERITMIEENVTYSKPENIGTKASYGFETNGKYTANNWLSFTGDFNYSYFDRKGDFKNQKFDFIGTRWSGRLGSKIEFPADIALELTGNYRSHYKTIQGEISGYAFMDMGIRKKIFKGKAILNIGIRDVFNSRIFENTVLQPTFVSNSNSQRGQFFTFGISYGFGKGEAMTYSGGRRR